MQGDRPEGSNRPLTTGALTLTLLTAALWGGNPVATSYSVDTLPPVAVAALRFAMAAAFMLLWCRIEGSAVRIRSGQLAPILGAGFLLFFQITTFNLGVLRSSASHASLMINTFVFWVVAVEHYVTRRDRLNPRKAAGLLLAAGGVFLLLVSTEQSPGLTELLDPPTLLGDAILLVSALLLAIKIVYVKSAVQRVEPAKLILWHDVVGVVLFAAYSLVFETLAAGQFTTPALLGLVYQGVAVGGLCFVIQARLLQEFSASQIAVASFATPVFGVALGVAFRGDELSTWLLLAGAAVAAGIYLVTRAPDM